jgi:hypothetical protein
MSLIQGGRVGPSNRGYKPVSRNPFIQLYNNKNVSYEHRWARLLKQQSSITIYRLLTKENKRPFSFAANQRMFAASMFRLQKTNGCRFQLVPFTVCGIPETWT